MKENGPIARGGVAQWGNPSEDDGFPGSECVVRGLPDGGIVTAKITRKADQRKRVNDPFRGVEIVPLRSVAVIARIGMMKIMIALAETHEGDQPTIAAAVFLAVGLRPDHVTE